MRAEKTLKLWEKKNYILASHWSTFHPSLLCGRHLSSEPNVHNTEIELRVSRYYKAHITISINLSSPTHAWLSACASPPFTFQVE